VFDLGGIEALRNIDGHNELMPDRGGVCGLFPRAELVCGQAVAGCRSL
jgi:hypothetical protein